MTVHLCPLDISVKNRGRINFYLRLVNDDDIIVCYGAGISALTYLAETLKQRKIENKRVDQAHSEGPVTTTLNPKIVYWLKAKQENCDGSDNITHAADPDQGLTSTELLQLILEHKNCCTWK